MLKDDLSQSEKRWRQRNLFRQPRPNRVIWLMAVILALLILITVSALFIDPTLLAAGLRIILTDLG